MQYRQIRLTGTHQKYFARSIVEYFNELVAQGKAVELKYSSDSYLLGAVYVNISPRFKTVKGDIEIEPKKANVILISQHSLDDVVKQLRKEFPQLKRAQ
jgi:hypothetical protein